MIIFKESSIEEKNVVELLKRNLPPKIVGELFYDYYTFEHKGKTTEGKIHRKNHEIINELRRIGFVYGLSEDVNDITYPKKYVLLWTKLKNFVDSNQTLTVDQSKFALITINNACKFLGVTRPTLYKILKDNEIPTIEILSQKRIQLKDLLDFIERNKK